MKPEQNKKKLTKEEKDKLLTEARAAARGKEIFPETMAEVREYAKKLVFPPSFLKQ
jgi:hypothetical protein